MFWCTLAHTNALTCQCTLILAKVHLHVGTCAWALAARVCSWALAVQVLLPWHTFAFGSPTSLIHQESIRPLMSPLPSLATEAGESDSQSWKWLDAYHFSFLLTGGKIIKWMFYLLTPTMPEYMEGGSIFGGLWKRLHKVYRQFYKFKHTSCCYRVCLKPLSTSLHL